MSTWVKVDRATGEVVERADKGSDTVIVRHKAFAWLPVTSDPAPQYDQNTQELVPTVTQTELGVPPALVPIGPMRVEGFAVQELPTDAAQAKMRTLLRAIFDAKSAVLVSGYAQTERETWPEQALSAEAYQADPNGEHPYLASMLLVGETVADLATKILFNREILKAASAALIAVRREHEAAIDAAEDNGGLRAIDLAAGWPNIEAP